jgi:broad specificity phosphatase PhoE
VVRAKGATGSPSSISNVPGTILLARHGETEWNRIGRWQGATDIPLSDVGRAQARELGERLRGRGIGRVHSSDLLRALETAQIVAGILGLAAPVVDARLRERGYGCFEGLTRAECETNYPGAWERYMADRRVTPPDAEPQADVVARVTAAMRVVSTAASEAESTAVLVVSHGGAIRSFVHEAFGILTPPVGNGSVFRLQFDQGRFLSIDQE